MTQKSTEAQIANSNWESAKVSQLKGRQVIIWNDWSDMTEE